MIGTPPTAARRPAATLDEPAAALTDPPPAAEPPPAPAVPRARPVADRIRPAASLVRHAGAFWRVANAAAGAHGIGRMAALRRMRRLRQAGYMFDEALRDGMLDPAIPDAALEGYAPRHRALLAQARVNPRAFEATTTEKAVFYRHCAALGLPTPDLYGVVTRTGSGWGVGDRVLDGPAAFADLIRGLPRDLVVKPSGGGRGIGVRVLRREGGVLVDAGSGARLTPEALWRELREHPEFEAHVVQERLRNHSALDAAVPSPSLHTIRLATFVAASGRTEISQAVIRLGIGGGVTDNFGDGSTGNGYAEIDLGSGRMGPLRMARPDGCGFCELAAVPQTGAPIEGVVVPQWREARALAFEAARHFLPTRSIGWDIAIADDGPVLVEANRFWAPFPHPGLARAIARIHAG